MPGLGSGSGLAEVRAWAWTHGADDGGSRAPGEPGPNLAPGPDRARPRHGSLRLGLPPGTCSCLGEASTGKGGKGRRAGARPGRGRYPGRGSARPRAGHGAQPGRELPGKPAGVGVSPGPERARAEDGTECGLGFGPTGRTTEEAGAGARVRAHTRHLARIGLGLGTVFSTGTSPRGFVPAGRLPELWHGHGSGSGPARAPAGRPFSGRSEGGGGGERGPGRAGGGTRARDRFGLGLGPGAGQVVNFMVGSGEGG